MFEEWEEIVRIQLFNTLFEIYSRKSRRKKVEEFFLLMDPIKSDTLLDVGGGTGRDFREIWNYFKKIIIVDINEKAMEAMRREVKHAETKVGDACNLSLDDKSVDYVFSNALIEHIPKERRCLFASEVKRVAKKGYFIATPNYYFPYEPHYKMLFWQYLPEGIKEELKKHFAIGWYGKGKYERIDLLSAKELRKLFPKAKVKELRITIWPETLICYETR